MDVCYLGGDHIILCISCFLFFYLMIIPRDGSISMIWKHFLLIFCGATHKSWMRIAACPDPKIELEQFLSPLDLFEGNEDYGGRFFVGTRILSADFALSLSLSLMLFASHRCMALLFYHHRQHRHRHRHPLFPLPDQREEYCRRCYKIMCT